MKITLAAVTAITGLLAVGTASAATHSYKATLNGAQEVPPVTTAATGTADLTFDDVAKTLTGKVVLTGISATTGQHLHHGELCGANAGNIIALPDPVSNEITVAKTLSAGEEGNLVAGKMYVNIHTAANTGGEIRGQLFKDGIGTCPAATDAGTDSGTDSGTTSSSGGSSSGGSSSGGSSGGSSGATTERPDSGTTSTAAPADDDSCNASGGGSPTTGALIALGVGIAVSGIARGRRKKK